MVDGVGTSDASPQSTPGGAGGTDDGPGSASMPVCISLSELASSSGTTFCDPCDCHHLYMVMLTSVLNSCQLLRYADVRVQLSSYCAVLDSMPGTRLTPQQETCYLQDAALEGFAAVDAPLVRPGASGSGAGPSLVPAAQPTGRPSSAPAATAAAKQVKRLHSPTEEASQKLQRRGSDGPGAGAAASGVAVNVAAPTRAAASGGQSVGLPAPTVNGIPANLAGNCTKQTCNVSSC